MSIKNWPGGRMSSVPPTPSGPFQNSTASGVWTLDQVAYWRSQDQWPTAGRLPPPVNTVAPVVTGYLFATQTLSCSTGTWTFTGSISYAYQWYRNGSLIVGATASSYTTLSSDEGAVFYCTVTATDNNGPASANSNSTAALGPVGGQQLYTRSFPTNTGGSFTWVAPAGVTSVSVLAVGGGGLGTTNNGFTNAVGGGGGGLGYRNNITVVPGNSYTVTLGATITFTSASYPSGVVGGLAEMFNGTGSHVKGFGGNAPSGSTGGVGGGFTGAGGGNGGNGGDNTSSVTGSSGGGAGGYSGNGGKGADYGVDNATAGSGGGGGGGGFSNFGGNFAGAGGGGVGLFGQGANGAPGNPSTGNANGGFGGSSGSNGGAFGSPYGGSFGGGSGGVNNNSGAGGSAVRIVWPGNLRRFPSTSVENF